MNGWIGVDLDGTLAEYNGWVSELHIGEPIPAMAERVRTWISEGREVRIFTARVGKQGRSESTIDEIRTAIQNWTEKHLGVRLAVTNEKDYGMVELWDDRAIRVIANTGVIAGGTYR